MQQHAAHDPAVADPIVRSKEARRAKALVRDASFRAMKIPVEVVVRGWA
jgi:hypothetical protein